MQQNDTQQTTKEQFADDILKCWASALSGGIDTLVICSISWILAD